MHLSYYSLADSECSLIIPSFIHVPIVQHEAPLVTPISQMRKLRLREV